MQLRTARLCLDCEELHDAQQCPVCTSESFAFISRWVPSPERRTGPGTRTPPPPAPPPPEAAVYRHLLVADAVRPKAVRFLKRGAVGLAAVSLARWAWRQYAHEKTSTRIRTREVRQEASRKDEHGQDGATEVGQVR